MFRTPKMVEDADTQAADNLNGGAQQRPPTVITVLMMKIVLVLHENGHDGK